jgi:SAM-dependent methyltransferase
MTADAMTSRQGDVEFQRALYEDANATRRGLHRARRDWVLDQALTQSKKGDRVLEVGVGCGIFTERLSAEGRKVSAVDINPAFLDNVSALKSVEVYRKDATQPLELGQHDLAICSEVLEHVPPERSQAMLDSLFGALKPGGILILTTPQRYSMVELGARLLQFGPLLALARKLYGSAEELGHINLLTVGALEDQLKKSGFEVRQLRRFGFYLPIVAEFGGRGGAGLLQGSGELLAKVPLLRDLLWTQGWVLTRPAA